MQNHVKSLILKNFEPFLKYFYSEVCVPWGRVPQGLPVYLLNFILEGNGGKLEWIEDKTCDDMNNNAACNYDGGDCCGIQANKRFCMECECICEYIKAKIIFILLI